MSQMPPPPPPPGGAPVPPPFGAAPTYGPAASTPLPPGVVVSSVGKRFGGYALDILLVFLTLIIGWLIWWVIAWGKSTSPGKQLLKMKCVMKDTGQRASFGTMALRELVGKHLIMWVISAFTAGIGALVLDFMLLWDRDRQQLWDKVASTIVVDDPNNVLT